MATQDEYLTLAVQVALDNVQNHKGRPFGALLVKDGQGSIVIPMNNALRSGHHCSATDSRRSEISDGGGGHA